MASKAPTYFSLLIFPTLLIIFYLSFYSQNKFNSSLSKRLPIPSNPLINVTNDNHHDFSSIFIFAKENEEKQKISKNKRSSLEMIEDGLARARAAIRKAARRRRYKSRKGETFIPRGPAYRNPYALQQSHKEMVKRFKIWTYKEGERPLVHQAPMNYVYGLDGHFMEQLEGSNDSLTNFIARHPDEAHVFFLPFSVVELVVFFYDPALSGAENLAPLRRVALDYVNVVALKYPYWNRSLGADHFMLSCHDWAPYVSDKNPKVYKNFIRAICNANTSEGFEPKRDVSIPEVNFPYKEINQPISSLGTSNRSILAFFSGRVNGHIRKLLFDQWENDDEIQVHQHLPKGENYFERLMQSKFCLCPSGFEVASSRLVEAIRADCVPVIVKQNYSIPFSDVLDWTKFSVYIPEEKIPEIKTILKGISLEDYEQLVDGLRSVKWHFTMNKPAKPFDLIHMVLHSIWLRRLNIRLPL
ncbi:probable glycosyltransferase At5g20260 [Amaranthus tricolor]|uniref:probable glycosyltransferase At5g20260 n=1 Tax=Amaranthus tricolor TaxID=29722 RepID=UPI00258A0C75|nr:probable glycosyltransferase At5g20260 [Amaranthus tricolor]